MPHLEQEGRYVLPTFDLNLQPTSKNRQGRSRMPSAYSVFIQPWVPSSVPWARALLGVSCRVVGQAQQPKPVALICAVQSPQATAQKASETHARFETAA